MKDANVFLVAVLNCFWPDGTINLSRTWREVRYLGRFLSSVLIALMLFVGVTAAPIVWIHSYIVPIPIVVKMFGVFHLDEETWEENIFTGEAGDVRKEYDDWRKQEGISWETSLTLQKFLWHSWYILAAYGLFLLLSFYVLLVRSCHVLFSNYKKHVFRRERIYSSRNQMYDATGASKPATSRLPESRELREGGTEVEKEL